jgi:UDP-glucose 4-epimerase
VRVIDRVQPTEAQNSTKNLEWVVGDISEKHDIQNALKGVTTVFHLAAIASIQSCNDDWSESSKSNYFGFVSLISAINERNQLNPLNEIGLVYASSAAVYGNCSNFPLLESEFLKPISVYGHEKRMMEISAELSGKLFGLKTVGLRFFNVYGPGQKAESAYSGVISRFVDALVKNQPIIVNGSGSQTRDFVHVDDVTEAIMKSTTKVAETAPVYNVCSGRSTSILEVATIINSHGGSKTKIVQVQERSGDVMVSLGSPTKAYQEIGFQAKIEIRTGLEALILDARRTSKN